jgi:hypothetical protein
MIAESWETRMAISMANASNGRKAWTQLGRRLQGNITAAATKITSSPVAIRSPVLTSPISGMKVKASRPAASHGA